MKSANELFCRNKSDDLESSLSMKDCLEKILHLENLEVPGESKEEFEGNEDDGSFGYVKEIEL